MILMIDNYDSFTFNVVQYLLELGAEVTVKRNDEVTVADIEAMEPQKIVISPGPCTPNEAGVSLDTVAYFAGKIPLLGICLGHQSIGQSFGGDIVRAKEVMHGKTSMIYHNGSGVFAELAGLLRLIRNGQRAYHGPLGKSDRAAAVVVLTVMVSFGTPPGWLSGALGLFIALHLVTIINRSVARLTPPPGA